MPYAPSEPELLPPASPNRPPISTIATSLSPHIGHDCRGLIGCRVDAQAVSQGPRTAGRQRASSVEHDLNQRQSLPEPHLADANTATAQLCASTLRRPEQKAATLAERR